MTEPLDIEELRFRHTQLKLTAAWGDSGEWCGTITNENDFPVEIVCIFVGIDRPQETGHILYAELTPEQVRCPARVPAGGSVAVVVDRETVRSMPNRRSPRIVFPENAQAEIAVMATSAGSAFISPSYSAGYFIPPEPGDWM